MLVRVNERDFKRGLYTVKTKLKGTYNRNGVWFLPDTLFDLVSRKADVFGLVILGQPRQANPPGKIVHKSSSGHEVRLHRKLYYVHIADQVFCTGTQEQQAIQLADRTA